MSEWSAKRFWESVTVEESDGEFTILLDGRNVKTPAKRQLIVPTKLLAEGIAAEWDAQVEKVDPLSMPFTRAANAAIDKVAIQKSEVAEMIAEYGGSDSTCYRASHPQRLIDRQKTAWEPILKWAEDTYDVTFVRAEGVMHHTQPAETMRNLKNIVFKQGPFSLTALHDLVSISGSLVIGLAAQKDAFDVGQLWDASILDEAFQIEEWGHDDIAAEMLNNKQDAFNNAVHLQRLIGMQDHTF